MKTPQEFFKEIGVSPIQFDGGLLACIDDNITLEQSINLSHMLICDPPYDNCLMTCFCQDESHLMTAISSASQACRVLRDRYYENGCL